MWLAGLLAETAGSPFVLRVGSYARRPFIRFRLPAGVQIRRYVPYRLQGSLTERDQPLIRGAARSHADMLGNPVAQTVDSRGAEPDVLHCSMPCNARIWLICGVIVRRQDQKHCASITRMIRHYVARRAQVTEGHPHNAEMSTLAVRISMNAAAYTFTAPGCIHAS